MTILLHIANLFFSLPSLIYDSLAAECWWDDTYHVSIWDDQYTTFQNTGNTYTGRLVHGSRQWHDRSPSEDNTDLLAKSARQSLSNVWWWYQCVVDIYVYAHMLLSQKDHVKITKPGLT